MGIAKAIQKKILKYKFIQQALTDEVIVERVRIWNELYQVSSVIPNPCGGPPILKFGEPALRKVVLPDLPVGVEVSKDNYARALAAPAHPSDDAVTRVFDRIEQKKRKSLTAIDVTSSQRALPESFDG